MNFFSRAGYLAYGLSIAAAFVSGCLPFVILAAAAVFGAPSNLWLFTYYLSLVAWTLCYAIPLLFLSSRAALVGGLAIFGSSAAVLYCAYAIFAVLRSDEKNPLFIGHFAAPLWLWLCLPLSFNIIQVSMSVFRFRQLRPTR